MTQLFESKSVLAKCLAEENIHVEHRKVQTAYFDLNSRSIILPIWKEMDGILYDLLMGHEVGHALYTPKQGWHDAVIDNKGLKSYLNVCEDARIERKIKDRYPGLRRSFSLAYKELHNRDFFGLNGLNVSTMRLIDRINIFFKLGAHVRVPFTPDEMKFVDRLNVAESWDDVELIARELYNKALEDKKNEPENYEDNLEDFSDEMNPDNNFEDEDYDDGDDYEDGNESDEFDESTKSGSDSLEEDKEDSSSDAEENETEQNQDDKKPSRKINKNPESGNEQDVSSITDNAQRKNEENLVDNSNGQIYILNVPEYNKNCIIPHNKVHDKIRSQIKLMSDHYSADFVAFVAQNPERYTNFIKRSNPVINYMIKEFEMRKNATQLSRAKNAKSGKINPKKLARFSLDRDIFQRVMSVPQGQNHGMVLFIDLSGSMQDILSPTFEQAILLTMFCKKTNIPFEVYGFSDHYNVQSFGTREPYFTQKANDLSVFDPNFHLKQYLSSSMSSSAYREAVQNMLYVGAAYASHYHRDCVPPSEQLYGTPLDESIIASINIVSEFKKLYKLDLVNSIFLTDGCGGVSSNYVTAHPTSQFALCNNWFHPHVDTVFIQHPDSKVRVRMEKRTKNKNDDDMFMSSRALIEIAQRVTGAKYTGYLIASKTQIVHSVMPYEFNYINYVVTKEQRKSILNKLNDDGFISSKHHGFSEYFFVPNNNLKIEDHKLEVIDGAKKGQIARAFAKSLNSRGLQRMFLNKFVQNIAV